MSQAAFLRQFDADAFAGFAAAGIADAATYLSPEALQAIDAYDPDDPDAVPPPLPVPCTVTVDRDVENFGDDRAPVSTLTTRIAFQRAEVAPAQRGRVTLLDELGLPAETFVLVERARADESLSVWWVQHA